MATTSPTGNSVPRDPAVAPGIPQAEIPVSTKSDEGHALGERSFELNPEVLQGAAPLPGLDEVEVVLVQPGSFLARWTEGLMIHVIGTGIVATISSLITVLVLVVGLKFGGASIEIGTATAQQPSCTYSPAAAPDYAAG